MQPPPPNNTNNQQQQQVPVSPAPSLMMQQQQPPGGGGSQAALPPPPQPQLQLHLQPSSGHIGGGGVGVGGVQAQLQLQLQMQQPQLQLQLQPTPMTVQPPAPMMTSISPQMVRQVTTLKAGPGQPYQQLQIQLGTQQYQTIQQQQHLLMVQQQQQTLQQQQILQQPQPSQAVMNNIQHQTSQPQSLPSSQQPQPMQVTSTTTSPSVRAAPHLSQSVITENGVTYFNLPRPMHEQCTKPTTATMMLQPRSFPMPGISSRDLTEDLPPDSLCAKLFGVFYSANGTVHTFTFFPKQPLKLTLWSHRDYMCYPPGFYENEPFCFGPNNCCEFAETFPVDLGDTNTRAECLRQNSLLSFIWESMDLEALTRPKSPPLRLDHWQRPALRICKGEHITITIFEATS
ncbi:hypothetical protein Pelo_2829 [Pelomyxa schiedti]|nr:hypothetical protein Pelo_2829 [Pelomyxa schiedti]